MSKLVQQRDRGDCGVAALAMMTGESYEVILKSFFNSEIPYGVDLNKMLEVLHILGFKPAFVLSYNKGIPGILSVPSLNTQGVYHWVYYDGEKILDPQTGREKNAYPLNNDTFYADASIISVKCERTKQILKSNVDFFNDQFERLK